MPAPKTFLKTTEAADYLGVSVRTIRRYVAEGHLSGYRLGVGQHLRFQVSDLDALMKRIGTQAVRNG